MEVIPAMYYLPSNQSQSCESLCFGASEFYAAHNKLDKGFPFPWEKPLLMVPICTSSPDSLPKSATSLKVGAKRIKCVLRQRKSLRRMKPPSKANGPRLSESTNISSDENNGREDWCTSRRFALSSLWRTVSNSDHTSINANPLNRCSSTIG